MSLVQSPQTDPEPQPASGSASVECLESTAVVHLSGELDLSTADEEHQAMARAVAHGGPLVVDLSGVEFMGAATVRLLVRCADRVQAEGRSFTIRRPSRFAAHVLTICGVDDLVADHAPRLAIVDARARDR